MTAYFGHNQYGEFVSTNEYYFPPKPWTGDTFSFMMDDLKPIWDSLNDEELQSWIPRAKRGRFSNYCAFMQVNANRWLKELTPVRIDY